MSKIDNKIFPAMVVVVFGTLMIMSGGIGKHVEFTYAQQQDEFRENETAYELIERELIERKDSSSNVPMSPVLIGFIFGFDAVISLCTAQTPGLSPVAQEACADDMKRNYDFYCLRYGDSIDSLIDTCMKAKDYLTGRGII